MSTTAEKLRGLVESLYKSSENEKIDWKLGSDQHTVIADISGYRVELFEEPGEQFETDMRITVYNSAGDQVDTFTDNFFKGMKPVNIDQPGYYAVMATTHEMAKRQASGADRAIDALLSSLGGTPVKDKPKGEFARDLDDDVPF